MKFFFFVVLLPLIAYGLAFILNAALLLFAVARWVVRKLKEKGYF